MRAIIVRDNDMSVIVGLAVVNDDQAADADRRVRDANKMGYTVHNVLVDSLEDLIAYLQSED